MSSPILGGLAAVTALGLGAGMAAAAPPADTDASEPAGKQPAGQLLATWSEADHDLDELRELLGAGEHVAIRTDDERVALLTTIDPWEVPADDVVAADLDAGMLVVGAYHSCMERGRVLVDDDDGSVVFEAWVAAEDEGVICDWAPYIVEVWSLPYRVDAPAASELGRVVVGDLVVRWSEEGHAGDELPDLSDHPGGLVLDTAADRDGWLAGLSGGLEATAVAATDLDHGFLVVGGYVRCADVGVVVADSAGATSFTTWVPELVLCAWAPYTVEVWYVADAEVQPASDPAGDR